MSSPAERRLRRSRPAGAGVLTIVLAVLSPQGAAVDVAPLWNFADPAASEAAFRAALRSAASRDDALSLQTQIARTLGLRSRFDEAHAVLDRIEPELAGAGAEPQVRHRLERGRAFRSAKRPEQARPLFVDAAERARAAGLDALRVDALHMVALVEPDPAEQLCWNRQALAVATASADPAARNWDASLLNNVGLTLHQAGRHAEALASFEGALAARLRIGNAARIAEARWMVAWTLRVLQRHDDALAILRGLEAAHAAAGSEDGFVFEELAENLLAKGRADEARPYFARAFSALSRLLPLDRPAPERLARLARLGR